MLYLPHQKASHLHIYDILFFLQIQEQFRQRWSKGRGESTMVDLIGWIIWYSLTQGMRRLLGILSTRCLSCRRDRPNIIQTVQSLRYHQENLIRVTKTIQLAIHPRWQSVLSTWPTLPTHGTSMWVIISITILPIWLPLSSSSLWLQTLLTLVQACIVRSNCWSSSQL